MLRYGANPNYSEVIRGIYPIMEAILGNHPDNVRLLINAGADQCIHVSKRVYVDIRLGRAERRSCVDPIGAWRFDQSYLPSL